LLRILDTGLEIGNPDASCAFQIEHAFGYGKLKDTVGKSQVDNRDNPALGSELARVRAAVGSL